MKESIGRIDATTKPYSKEIPHPLVKYKDQYVDFLLNGQRYEANQLVKQLLDASFGIKDIYIEIFQNSQYDIGLLWQSSKISIAKEHYCTASTQAIMGQLYPLIFGMPKNGLTFVATSIGGELHELGIRMVSDIMELSGWNTYYLGANTPTENIIETLITEKSELLGISVTMQNHISEVENLIKLVRENAITKNVKILVGGYPFILDDQLWKKIGADGFARNAIETVQTANKLIDKEDLNAIR